MLLRINILILNFNGKDLLERYLPSFRKAVQKSHYACRLGVIDNKSTDDSVHFLEENHPGVDIYLAEKNKVLCSYNDIARELSEDILIFMNNDIEVKDGFIDPLIEPFENDPNLFFTAPRASAHDGSYEGNKTKARIHYGVFWSSDKYPGHLKDVERTGPTFQAGYGAFDRGKFLTLGGYDDLYLPGTVEDADVCFRAYKKGWHCLYVPKSVVYHQGRASFYKVFGVEQTRVINWRNTFLFMWKNLGDKINFFEFVAWLPFRCAYFFLTGQYEFFIGFWQALRLWPEARKRRRELKQSNDWGRVSDKVIFEISCP